MEITERLLNDAGGWQTMKQARALHEMGRIKAVTWEEPLLRGQVREGETEFRSGLRIVSRTNIENLCTCRASRQHGAICSHSVAVGLEWLKPRPEAAAAASSPAAAAAPAPRPAQEPWPRFSVEEGTPAEFHVLFPPNFAAAWPRGGVAVTVEALAGGKRLLVSALPPRQTYRVEAADLRLATALRRLGEGDLPGAMMLPPAAVLSLLEALPGHPRITFARKAAVEVKAEPYRPALKIEPQPDGGQRLAVAWAAEEQVLRAGSASPWVRRGDCFQPLVPGLPPAYHVLLEEEITIPPEAAGGFLERELPALATYFEFTTPAAARTATGLVARPVAPAVSFQLELEGSLNFLQARLQATYGEHRLTLTRAGQATSYPRDQATEQAALARLQAAGFSPPDLRGEMVLKGEPRILAFFARELSRWEKEATVTIGSRFQHVTSGIERLQPRLEVRSAGQNWFDLQVELATPDGERFSGTEIRRLLQGGQAHLRSRTGKITVFDPAMLDELEQTLRDCEPSQRQPGTYRIGQEHAPFLQAVAEEQGASLQAPADWRASVQRLAGTGERPPVPLGSLEEVLRPYQKTGVAWMMHLARSGLAGILADEMGLGKTLQALALLRALGGKGLIVCPSSLVYNWQREAVRFTPERRVLTIEGSARQAAFGRPLAEADLVVTSYALLRRDAEQYRGIDFSTVILDEAQHIKNPDTQNAQSAFALRSRHRFVLTGTPVENSVRDLWSLTHFLMPGYLGKREEFRDRYEKPIQADPGGPEQRRLAKRLRPFILRRRKLDVLTELPEKIEQVAYCELTKAQRQLYEELARATRRQVSELAGSPDQGEARILMLTALLRLRQACCDPRLLTLEKPLTGSDSAKLELFGELLQESMDGGHRVLVFSQFTGMLKLLQEWLVEQQIDHCYLDGATKHRAREVDRFQEGTAPVFLISLKAGGVGLNLTAADTVMHFDPWWNPAVEAQATDRAHRMGQKKVVTSYKLITRGTVEEKILSLQEKKRQVIAATLESEEPMMEGLTFEDLQSLLD